LRTDSSLFVHTVAGSTACIAAIIIFPSRFADVTRVLLSGPLADICKRRRLGHEIELFSGTGCA
jgi:hypothetical protein